MESELGLVGRAGAKVQSWNQKQGTRVKGQNQSQEPGARISQS